jgi:dienelactone hydrolase
VKIFLVTDIFGDTNAVETLTERLNTVCERVYILDPYDARQMNFRNEEEAYETFTQTCGLENYAQMCLKALEAFSNEEVVIIGFSMGASALWKALAGRKDLKIKHFFGFYASQIRHITELDVDVETTLLFPQSETHFDVDSLMQTLASKPHVTCVKTPYLHGFMNELSHHFNADGYTKYCQWLKNEISELTPQE